MTNIAQRIIKQIRHDHRSMGMIIIVPLLLLSLLYLLLGKSDYTPKIAVNNMPAVVVASLEKQDTIKIIKKDSNKSPKALLKEGKADAVLWKDAKGQHLLLLEADSVKVSIVSKAVSDVLVEQGKTEAAALADKMEDLSKNLTKQMPAIAQLLTEEMPEFDIETLQIDTELVYGKEDQSIFDSLGFLLLGILAFFLIFLFSGISFVRERTSNTVERLMLTPIKTTSVVGGYMLGFGFFAVLQSVIVILFAKFVLKMQFAGDWWLAMLIMLLLAMVAVVMGTLVSALSKNEFQVVQFIPAIIIPQIFFSGLIPVDTLPYHLDLLSKIMPIYYGSMGLKEVLVYGNGIDTVYPWLLALCAFIVVLFVANIFAVKKYRAV